jgi:chromosome segregation ATPase
LFVQVDKLATLQHELEESERKLNIASMELDCLSQEQILLVKELTDVQDLLQCKNDELSEFHNAAESLTSELANLQDKFLETQKVLAAKIEYVAILEHEACETQEQLKCTSQEVASIKMENVEVKQNLDYILQQLGVSVEQVERMLSSDEDTLGDAERLRADGTEGSLPALCLSVKAKTERLNFMLIELDAKNLKSLSEWSNLELTCKQLNESIIKLRGEIVELVEKEKKHLLEKSMLDECLQQANENVSVLQTKISEYAHKIQDLNSLLEDKNVAVEYLENVKQSLSDKNEKLEELREEEAEKLQKVETELIEITQDKVLLQDKYNKLKEFSEEQTKTVNMLNCKIAELEKQIQELVQEKDFSNNNLQNIICKLQETQETKEILEQTYSNTLQENEESIEKLNDHVNVLKDRIHKLENRVALADEELECMKENLGEISKNRDILKLQYDIESQEKGKQIELLNQHVRKLEATVVELQEEKNVTVRELECIKLNLSETVLRSEIQIEKFNETILEKEEYVNNFRITMEKEVMRLEHERETISSALEIAKVELHEVTASKDEMKMLYEKENEEYKIEFANLSDKLTSLASEIEAIEQEKTAAQDALQCKTNELTDTMRSYETLLDRIKQLEAAKEEQLQQLKISTDRYENLAKEKKIVAEELTITRSELAKEKQCKESLSEELSEKHGNLIFAVQESDNLRCMVRILEEEKNLLQNTIQHLTSELTAVRASKDELMQEYNSLETEKEKILAVRMKLEMQVDSLEKETSSISNDLSAARSDLLLHKEQHENITITHNKEIEKKEETITQLMNKSSTLQDEIKRLDIERKDLYIQLHTANSEVSELKTCKEHLLQLCNKVKAENETLEITKISLDKKIEELLHEMNSIIEELGSVRASVLVLQESKVLLTEQHSKELHEREEKIDRLLKDKAALQNLLDQTIEERNELNKNMQLTESELLEVKRSKDELLEAHTKQIQETEENIMSAHKNAVEVKAMLLKKVEEVEGERDMEIKLRAKVEQLLNEEKKNMGLVLTQMNELVFERKIVSQLCHNLRDNVSSLRMTIAALQEQIINEKGEVGQKCDTKDMVISTPEHLDGTNNEYEGYETESLHVFYDMKNKLPTTSWNLNPMIDLSVCAGKLTSSGCEHRSDGTVSENVSGLLNNQDVCMEVQAIPIEAKSVAMKIAGHEDTGTNSSEVINSLEGPNVEFHSARGEIMGVLKLNDNLQNKLSSTDNRGSDLAQKCADITVTIGILNSENEKLLKSIEELENLKLLLETNERDLTTEHNSMAELKAEKEILEESYGVLKDDFQKLKKDNESLSTAIDTMKNQMSSLHKHNLELNEKVQKYEMSYLKCEEEYQKFISIRKERELEFNKLLNSETILKQKMSEFQKSLKDINYKFEILVLGTATSLNELKVIEHQRIKLEELLTLISTECEEISHNICNCTYDSLKQTEQNIENQHSLLGIAVHLVTNEPPEIALNLDRESKSDVTEENVIENKRTWQQQELVDLQVQIGTLISGIGIALKKCKYVDTQCNEILEMYKTKIESEHMLSDRNAFGNMKDLSYVDRTNLIKDIVTKIQVSGKKHAELEMEEDGWNHEDLLEMESSAKSAGLTSEEEAQKEHDKKGASHHSAILKMRLSLGKELSQKTKEVDCLTTQNKSLQVMLQEEQNSKAELERNLTELRALNQALSNDKETICKLKSAEEEKCLQLELELQKTSQIKQAYETLLEVNYRLQSENDDMKHKMEENTKAVRQEYEKKLDRLKAKMVSTDIV